jgi:hypothetical protein
MSNTNAILPFGLGVGSNVMSSAAWSAIAARLSGFESGLAQSIQVNTAMRQAAFVATMIAQFTADFGNANVNDDANIAALESNFEAALAAFIVPLVPFFAGPTLRLNASLTSAGTSVAFTADEIGVANGLGASGTTLASYSQTLNVSTTGAGGMDIGSAPASGFVSIYAIYNPTTQTQSILGTTASSGTVYNGAHMPAGYTMSSLISVWKTNGSSQLVAAYQIDRQYFYAVNVQVLTTSSATTPTSISMTAAIPLAARTFTALFSIIETGSVGASSDGFFGPIAGVLPLVCVAAVSGGQLNTFATLPVGPSQTSFYKVGQASVEASVTVTGYSI